MTAWSVEFLEEAREDLRRLDGSVRIQVLKAIKKVQANPLPSDRGGYGKPLGSRASADLTGLMKVKLRGLGIRIVYKVEERDGVMLVIIIGARNDFEVYHEAQRRREKHDL